MGARRSRGIIERVERFFHIARIADWEHACETRAYRVSTLGKQLENEGFIHLPFAHQVKTVADAVCHGMTDLVLLELDAARLPDRVRFGAVSDSDERFPPHLYSEITPDMVLDVNPFAPGPDGRFDPTA